MVPQIVDTVKFRGDRCFSKRPQCLKDAIASGDIHIEPFGDALYMRVKAAGPNMVRALVLPGDEILWYGDDIGLDYR